MRPGLLLLAVLACARAPEAAPSLLQRKLESAADLEGVPRALLVAMAYADSRLRMNQPSPDGGHGLLHLIDRAGAPEARSLFRAALLTGLSPEALRTDPFANARGGAALLRAEAERLFSRYPDLDQRRLGDWWEAVMRLSGVDDARVADSYAAQVYRLLRDGFAVEVNGELVRLAPQEVEVSARAIWGRIEQDLSGEYCPNGACVAFVPASGGNFTAGRGGNPITTIVIHDMEGSYAGSIGWFQDPAAQASAHYLIRSSDGEITQMVRDGDTAWHAGNWAVNQHSIGIEHEGYASTGYTWYTEAMYRSSAALARWLADTFGVARDRTHIIGHDEVPDPNHAGWYGGASHHHDPCDAWAGDPTWHNTTACWWDWAHYLDLVTGATGTGVLTGFVGDACCGISAGTRKPLAGAVVTLQGTTHAATTDASGIYSFTLPAGSYTPRASFGGYGAGDHTSLGAGYPATLSVAAGATTWGSILLRPAASTPVPPSVAIASPADGAALISTPAAVRGTVSDPAIVSVTINGRQASASNGAFSGTAALVQGSNAITVTASNSAGTGSATVHVTYAPMQAGVQGRVSSADGPVANAGISLSPGGAHTVTAADGSYAIEAAAGTYTLSVDAMGFQPLSQPVTVAPGRVVNVDLALQPAGPGARPHVRVDSPGDGATVDRDSVLVSGVAMVPDLRALFINDEQVAAGAQNEFAVMVALRPGRNQLVITAMAGSGATATATVNVTFAPHRGGCGSAGQADLLGLIALALLAARRRRT